MKTKITILALLLCFPLFLAAQNDNINENDSLTLQKGYKSFFGENKTKHSYAIPAWCKSNYDNKMEPYQRLGCCYTLSGTININNPVNINNLTYYHDGACYLREDTSMGRVYRYVQNDNSEILVCDMSLSVGDTFVVPDIYNENSYIKMSADSIVYDENYGKIIFFRIFGSYSNSIYMPEEFTNLNTEYYQIPMAFIEGIGPTYSFMGGNSLTGLTVLLCVSKDDTLTYIANELLGCYQFLASVKDKDKVSLHVYPNPASQRVSVGVGDWGGGGTLRLVNAIGMVLQTKEITDNVMEFDISNYANGLYTILYTDDKNNRAAVKFVKQ